MKRMAAWITASSPLVGWVGVASSAPERVGGEIRGRWRVSPDQHVPITLRYSREPRESREQVAQGRMRLRMGEDGEQFVGEYIRVSPNHAVASLRRFYLGWSGTSFDAVRTGPLGSPWTREEWSYEVFAKRLEGGGNRGPALD